MCLFQHSCVVPKVVRHFGPPETKDEIHQHMLSENDRVIWKYPASTFIYTHKDLYENEIRPWQMSKNQRRKFNKKYVQNTRLTLCSRLENKPKLYFQKPNYINFVKAQDPENSFV